MLADQNRVYAQASRGFAMLLPLQWLAMLGVVSCLSPRSTLAGGSPAHSGLLSMWSAGAIISLPVYLALKRPQELFTRHAVAVGQMLVSSLLIQLTHGSVEAHFHILVSLVFLSYYRDWRILITAAMVISADHFLRGFYLWELVATSGRAEPWRWLGHTGWIGLMALTLARLCQRGSRESWEAARRQAAIEMFTGELEHTVRQRTRDLEGAKEAAEAASRAKTDFLANASHEIRTPMNAILGMAEILSETSLNAEQRHYVEVFRNAGATLMMLINDLLDLSKIESGHLDLEVLDFDLEAVVDHVMDLIAATARAKGLLLLSRIEPGTTLNLIGDPRRLTQILLNLLGNALKFTETGEVMLTLKNGASGEAGRIDFAVTDTGVGIPEEKLETIFEAFNQADSSTNRKYGGTGLGLSISRQLVERMGGNLRVESTPQQGSTFSFSVKFEIADRERSGDTATAELCGRRVLIISSNAHERLILDETLRSWGMETRLFASPSEAFAALSSAKANDRTFSLAIADGEGSLFARVPLADIVQRSAPGAPILLLTSDVAFAGNHVDRQPGIVGSIARPVRRSELRRLIREIVKEGKPRASKAPNRRRVSRSANWTRPRRFNVLLAEDSMENRLVVENFLRKSPFGLSIAVDGQSAVEQFQNGRFDLVLMDMQMPVMDGITAARAIREWERAHGLNPTPLIALTASARAEDIRRCQEAGCTAHLAKPIAKQALLDALGRYLGTAPEEAETREAVMNGGDAEGRHDARAEEMPDELKAFVPDYVRAMKEYAGEMMKLLETDNFSRIQRLAHDIKGTGGSYGFPELTHLAAELENSAKALDGDAVSGELLALREFLERVPV